MDKTAASLMLGRSPHPAEVKLVLPGSLVVDAEGVEDVQEGRDEGE